MASSASQPPPSLNPPLASSSLQVSGRSFVITGATGAKSLGLAVARHLREAGAAGLVLVSRSPSKGAEAVQELRDQAQSSSSSSSSSTSDSSCRVEYLQADLSDATEAASIIPRAVELLNKNNNNEATKTPVAISGVVNCAATTARGNLMTETADGFDRQMAVNVRAPFLVTQAAAKHMMQHQVRGGSIVNIISCAAYGGAPFIMAYSASKAALVALTKCHAAELAPHGIRVNGVNMGWCFTENEDALQTEQTDAQWIQRADAGVGLGRILRPQDAAVTIGFLLSDAASMTTGTVAELHPEFAHGMLSLADTDAR